MIHYGDITKISGYDVPIVDCVVGGSPCQNLSVAGKRTGLDGEQSKLFMEQIRITKEMRENDRRLGRSGEFIRPRYFIWENVPGAFSSNKGKDFRVVLEEVAKIAQEDAVIPMPPKDKWATSGAIMGDGWSIAWRVLDAQFWGVPQRRRRIALVADFGGGCAPEILFERKSLRRDSSESREERERTSSNAEGCTSVHDRDGEVAGNGQIDAIMCIENSTGRNTIFITEDVSPTLVADSHNHACFIPCSVAFEPGIASREGGHIYEDVSGTLRANAGDNQMSVAYSIENHPADSRVNIDESGKVQTLTSRMGTGGGNVPMVMVEGLDCYNQTVTGDKAKALTNSATDADHIPCVVKAVGCDIYNLAETGDVAASLTTASCQGASNTGPSVIVMDRSACNQGENAKYNIGIDENRVAFTHIAKGPGAVCCLETFHCITEEGTSFPLKARDYKDMHVICLQGNQVDRADTSVCNGSGLKEGTSYTLNTMDRHCVAYEKPHYIVRRLTPLECERLQGYADGWTDIGEYIDSKGKRKKTSDSARYKALGNSIALPPWKWVIKRISAQYERDATLASLFDGIGGFPCLWEQINGKGSCIWASEIEDFPIAVTKTRIG